MKRENKDSFVAIKGEGFEVQTIVIFSHGFSLREWRSPIFFEWQKFLQYFSEIQNFLQKLGGLGHRATRDCYTMEYSDMVRIKS